MDNAARMRGVQNKSRACEVFGWVADERHASSNVCVSMLQIPADYICSACMRAEREDVVVIRLDEQVSLRNLRQLQT